MNLKDAILLATTNTCHSNNQYSESSVITWEGDDSGFDYGQSMVKDTKPKILEQNGSLVLSIINAII